MKPPESDFRPKRRAGHVPSSRRRKIPLLRIVLLVVAAALVYRHFDHFWPRLRAWVKPSATQNARLSRHGDSTGVWIFSADSSQAFLNLGAGREKDDCADLERLRAGLCAQEHAALRKAAWFGTLRKPLVSRLEVSLPRGETPAEIPARLIAMEGRDSTGNFHYRRVTGGEAASPWCEAVRGCLTPLSPRIPLLEGKLLDSASEAGVARWHSPSSEVFPALPGIVVSADSLGPRSYRVTLYHGNELYTRYETLRGLTDGLKTGTQVDPLRPIGLAAATDSAASGRSSGYDLEFRVTQAGMPLDPMEFLASAESGHNAP